MEKEKITLIELLGMIANGQAMPQQIESDGLIYCWDSLNQDYWCGDNEEHFLFGNLFNYSHYNLNKVVLITPEYCVNDIEKIIDKLEKISEHYEFGEDYDVIPTAIGILEQYLKEIEREN